VPSSVSSLPSSLAVPDTDSTGGLDKSAWLGDAGYDPVVDADELERILGLSRMIARTVTAGRDAASFGTWS
jgi:hypothetical protein